MFMAGAGRATVVGSTPMKWVSYAIGGLLVVAACSQSGNGKSGPPPNEPVQPDVAVPTTNVTKRPAAVVSPSASKTRAPVRVATTAPRKRHKKVSLARVGLSASALDRSAKACTNFFKFACGGWLAKNKIPADKSRWGRLDEVRRRNLRALRRILETAAKTPKSASPLMAKLGRFYKSCTDTSALNRAGTSGIKPLLKVINKATGKKSLTKAITTLHRHGVWAAFSFTPAPDFKQSKRNILFLDQGGLGLPDRDYYLPGKTKYDAIRGAYRAHVQRMFGLLGMAKGAARRATSDAIAVEAKLARMTKTRVERRNLAGLYNPVDRAGLNKLVGNFSWNAYFSGLKHAGIKDISVTAPRFFKRLGSMLGKVPKRAWRNYLKWQLLHHTAGTLPPKFAKEAFKMKKLLRGQKEQRPRWKRCVAATGDAMPHYLAQPYIVKRFGADSRRYARRLVGEIGKAFDAELKHIPWMHKKTKAAARAKRRLMKYQIGYPKKWKSYGFSVSADNFAANSLAARALHLQRELDKAGKPVDSNEWTMSATRVNASYNPLHNRMTFPAGILQPPFYSRKHTNPVNLGAMGMIVGHELTHGFDDSGARFDGHGNMRNWWHKSDASKFLGKAQCVVKQYSRYKPLRGERVNGRLTLGENIADLGGIKIAFKAYRKLAKKAKTIYTAGGFTEDQQFFLAVGQAWCSKTRNAEIRRRLVTDPHAPPRYRVNGALSNLREFSKAFGCKAGARMRRKKTCQIW